MKEVNDLTGQRFGKLIVVSLAEKVKTNRQIRWLCKCDCGNEKIIYSLNLKKGATKSCGCLADLAKRSRAKHRQSKSKLYGIWQAIIRRCENSTSHNYLYYGGRGVSICESWRNDYQCFSDFIMNLGWKPGLEIDRYPNGDGDYSPENVRLLPKLQSVRRRRGVKLNAMRAQVIRTLLKKTSLSPEQIGSMYGIRRQVVSSVGRNASWR